MKIHSDVQGLCPCYSCGSENVVLLSNAIKRFQVRCLACGVRTRWKRKHEVIIDWYNLYIEKIEKNASVKN